MAGGWRRRATLAAPVAVPVTMAAVFAALRRRLPPRPAYIVGFLVYWAGWCIGFPLWVLGPRGVARVLCAGRRPGRVDVALLAFPVAGAIGAELLPHRRLVDRQVAGVMAGTAAVNAVGGGAAVARSLPRSVPRRRGPRRAVAAGRVHRLAPGSAADPAV